MKASIHIAFGLEDRGGAYAPHMAATMVSILEHTARPVTFHVLTDASLVEASRAQTPWGDPAALALAKAQRTQALEDAVLTAPIGSRKAFLRNVLRRLAREAKAVWDMMK